MACNRPFRIESPRSKAACESQSPGAAAPPATPEVPFLTMPTACPAQALSSSPASTTGRLPDRSHRPAQLPAVDGCNQLRFEPSIEAHPTTNLADSPSGFDFDLKVPQNEEGPEGAEDPTASPPPT